MVFIVFLNMQLIISVMRFCDETIIRLESVHGITLHYKVIANNNNGILIIIFLLVYCAALIVYSHSHSQVTVVCCPTQTMAWSHLSMVHWKELLQDTPVNLDLN